MEDTEDINYCTGAEKRHICEVFVQYGCAGKTVCDCVGCTE